MDNKNNCNICKIRAYITCDECQKTNKSTYFCSKLHLNMHIRKTHENNNNNVITLEKSQEKIKKTNENIAQNPQIDIRKLFETLQKLKIEIDQNIDKKNFIEAILLIQKSLSLSKNFYQPEDKFNLELLFKLSESFVNIHNLEEAINNLEELILFSNQCRGKPSYEILRYRAFMLISACCLNIGEYTKSLKYLNLCEKEVLDFFSEPELHIKLSSVYLNIGIVYIYMTNFNTSEKYLRKGLLQTEGMLGNDIIYKINADFYENLGVIAEANNKYKEALEFYKKSLKIKFGLYGDKNDEVLDLQYKISSVYLLLKQYKECEQVLVSLTDVISNEKLKTANIDQYYRYGCYFYTLGISYMKNNKINNAKVTLKKVLRMWEAILPNNDPGIQSINNLYRICEDKLKNNI